MMMKNKIGVWSLWFIAMLLSAVFINLVIFYTDISEEKLKILAYLTSLFLVYIGTCKLKEWAFKKGDK